MHAPTSIVDPFRRAGSLAVCAVRKEMTKYDRLGHIGFTRTGGKLIARLR